MSLNRLPNFLIIGASRSGTTSLFFNLIKHPCISGPKYNKKELHFFDSGVRKGLNWYNDCFPEREENMVHLEATPNYFHSQNAPQEIKRLMPDIRFIVMLRNPIDRTWSDFWTSREKRRGEFEAQELTNSQAIFVEKSVYVEYLKKWLECFARDKFLILKSEEFFQDERAVIKECFRWMNLDPIEIDELIYSGGGKYEELFKPQKSRIIPSIPPNIFFWLKKYYKPHNEELYSFLGRNFEWEKEGVKYE